MKIKKLIESKKLIEAEDDDTTLSEVDPQKDSVSEIADAVQGSVDANSGGESEVSDEAALKIAKEIKDTATEVGAGYVEFAPQPDDYGVVYAENRLTRIFDDALETARNAMADGEHANANVLIEGLPGSGKTAIVEAWVKHHGLVLCAINVTDSKLETSINGMPLRDLNMNDNDDRNKITRVKSDLFDGTLLNPANKGKCILFVDELNRQQDDQIRRPLMSLFNEKRNADGTLDFTETLLFTIVCINPSGMKFKDKGVVDLNDAEIGRFGANTYMGDNGYDSNVDDALNYCDAWFESRLLKLGININKDSKYGKRTGIVGPWKKHFTATELATIDRILKTHDLWSFILNHPDFEFDSREDLDDLHDNKKTLLSARTLFDLMYDAAGNPQKFLRKIGEVGRNRKGEVAVIGGGANLLVRDVEMFHKILSSYICDINELRADVGLFVDADGNVISKEAAKGANNTSATANTNDEPEETGDVEDDDDLFADTASNGGKTQSTPGATAQDTDDIISSW